MNALRLERGEEALHGRIIQAIAASAHRHLAIVEFDRPPDAMSLHSAFGEVADVSARMLNLYAPYFRG